MIRKPLVPLALAASLVAVGPAAADVFTIQLANGTTFETRYQPKEASWDSGTILFISGTGNWVGLAKADVVAITSDSESRGYGRVIDTTTIDLGLAPNDRPEETAAQANQRTPLEEILGRSYDIEQFAEPSVFGDGAPTGGLPVFGVGAVGGGSFQAPPSPGVGPVSSPTPGTPPPAAPTPGAPDVSPP